MIVEDAAGEAAIGAGFDATAIAAVARRFVEADRRESDTISLRAAQTRAAFFIARM
jgi:hypothetical protein